MQAVVWILEERQRLNREHANALIAAAEKELDSGVDLWQFAKNDESNIRRKPCRKLTMP